mmetsp:Transcript_14808/g.34736  ORF Transcript_14808/g.34736 Transcript_14808/m.34736 type:complete len:399 (+) Transcript_14808:83-1279(+)
MSSLRQRKTDDGPSSSDGKVSGKGKRSASSSLLFKAIICLVVLITSLIGGVALVGRLAPTLFLQIPAEAGIPGFVLWFLTGNPLPPYFTDAAWGDDEFKSWIKPGDLVVAVGMKSGTHWMLYCSHQIRTKGEGDFHDVSTSTPWPDFVHRPGQTWAEVKELMNTTTLKDGTKLKDHWDNPAYPFRIFKSHYTPRTDKGGVLAVRENADVKFLAMARNGLDAIASLSRFWDSIEDGFRAKWGGFPPLQSDEETFTSAMPGGNLYQAHFPYVREWWQFRNEPNVLLLHYADAKKDLLGTVKKMAAFLDVSLTDTETSKVVEQCGFKHMKTVENKMMFTQWGDVDEQHVVKLGQTIRKGTSGSGKSFVTPEMQKVWDEALLSEFPDPVMREWALNGGPLPP